MRKYAACAHAAAQAVATSQLGPECLHSANDIVREFLLDVCRQLLDTVPDGVSQLAAQCKRAANALLTHPYRVHDRHSAQKVHGCGPAIARMIEDNLFAEYPPEPPGDEELEELARQETAAKAAAAAQRKRKKQDKAAQEAAAAGHATVAPLAAAAPGARADGSGGGVAAASAGDEEEGKEGQGRRRAKRAEKEYIPQLGSAPFAFLIVMLQGQKGPEKKGEFGKQELIDRAEASRLSSKPIRGDGTAQRRGPGGQQFSFDGWTSFRKQLVGKGFVNEYSNPKKCCLTEKGLALAERLYRDGVARGLVQPIPGIPTEGPMLFQPEAPDTDAVAGLPGSALPSTALQGGWQPPEVPAQRQQQQQQQQPPQQQQQQRAEMSAAVEAALRRAARASGGRGAAAAAMLDDHAYGSDVHDAAVSFEETVEEDELDLLSLPLPERLRRQRQAQQQQQKPQQAAGGRRRRATSAAPVGVVPTSPVQAVGSPGGNIIDLLSDSESPSPLVRRGRPATAAAAAAAAAKARHHSSLAAAARGVMLSAAPAPAGERVATEPALLEAALEVPDEQVAAMVAMGYSDKKARRALRKSLGEVGLPDIGLAVEFADGIDSDAKGDSDAQGQELEQDFALGAGLGRRRAKASGQRAAGARQRGGEVAAAPAAAAAQWDARDVQEQRSEGQPQRGWEQPPAALDWPAHRPPLGPGDLPAGVPSGAQQRGSGAGGGLGHVRMGSQHTLGGNGSRELSRQASDLGGSEPYNVDAFLAQLDRRLAGGVGEAPPARTGSGSGSGGGGEAGGASIRQSVQDVRLPPLPPGRRFGDEYEVVLVLDQREQFGRSVGQGRGAALEQHLTTMRQAGVVVEGRQLPIGDAIWVARSRARPLQEWVLDRVVERKSVNDLVKSIMDKEGRYEKQKYYLKRCGLRQVYYLVEGDPDMLPKEQEQKMARSATASVEIVDGFTVLRTADANNTFRLFERLTTRIRSTYRDLGPGGGAAGQLPSFEAWQAQCKANAAGTLTLHDVWGIMLAAVPTLGPDATQAILAAYPTPLHLYRAYKDAAAAARQRGEDGHRAAERLLLGLKSAGGAKSIGHDKSAKVYQVLFRKRIERRGAGQHGEA